MVRKAEDQLHQAQSTFQVNGQRPRAFFPHSPVKRPIAEHIMLENPVTGEICDVIEHWSEAGDLENYIIISSSLTFTVLV